VRPRIGGQDRPRAVRLILAGPATDVDLGFRTVGLVDRGYRRPGGVRHCVQVRPARAWPAKTPVDGSHRKPAEARKSDRNW